VFEVYLALYLLAVVVSTYFALKQSQLLVKSPAVQLEEKRQLVEEAMQILNSMCCPFCRSRETYVERVDLFKSNIAVVNCNGCKQKAMWKLENGIWHLIAPYRYLPTLPTTPASTIVSQPKEEIKLEFG
jgi:hypothetical protein